MIQQYCDGMTFNDYMKTRNTIINLDSIGDVLEELAEDLLIMGNVSGYLDGEDLKDVDIEALTGDIIKIDRQILHTRHLVLELRNRLSNYRRQA